MSWCHWQQEVIEFVDAFTTTNGLEVTCALEVCRRCSKNQQYDLILMFIGNHRSPSLLETKLDQLCELLPNVSRDWRYQISSAKRESQKILFCLFRPGVCIGAIQAITNFGAEDSIIKHPPQAVATFLDTDTGGGSDCSLTAERLQLVHDVTVRLLRRVGHRVCEADLDRGRTGFCPDTVLSVTTNSRLQLPPVPAPRANDGANCVENSGFNREEGDDTEESAVQSDCESTYKHIVVVVEPVVNLKTGKKEKAVKSAVYRGHREAALLSAGQSRKRGCSTEQAAIMARASVSHELLSVSVTSPCRVSTDGMETAPATDTAVFALYNAARLRAVLDGFEAGVAAGTYPPLPSVAQIGHEFHRLATQDEWELVWRHLLPLPSLLGACADGALCGRPALHRLCAGLTALSHTFSRYYSRTHVLTPPLEHLMETLHVRIHLLKAVHAAFSTFFDLLGYRSLQRM